MKNRVLGLLIGAMLISAVAAGCQKKTGEPAAEAAVEEAQEEAAEDTVEEAVSEEAEEAAESEEGQVLSPDDAEDFTGEYWADGDTQITLEPTEVKNQYKVQLSIVRLCQMDGIGDWSDGCVEIEFTDPNGNFMYGVFFPEDNGTYTLRITQSEWDYIESGSDFTNFHPESMMGVPNPWRDVSEEDFFQEMGVTLNVPEGAEDLNFSISQEGIGEMFFKKDGVVYCVRISASLPEFTDISGLYYDWTVEDTAKIGYNEAKYFRYVGEEEMLDLIQWYDVAPGIMYSVSAYAPDLNGFDLQPMAESIYVQMQGEV